MLSFLPLLTVVAADSYYNAETCGRTQVRHKRDTLDLSLTNETDVDHKGQMKVMGGERIQPGEMPWSIFFTIPQGEGKAALCGGSMISSRHLLTAAHYMVDSDLVAQGVKFYMGATCYKAAKCKKKEVVRRMRRIAFVKQFFEDTCRKSFFDVALIELDRPVDTSHACLPHLHNIGNLKFSQTDLMGSGFGAYPLCGKHHAEHLMKINLGKPVDRTKCAEKYKLSWEYVLCTQETLTKNVCAGDGGGNLGTHGGRYFLHSWVSYGSPCDGGQVSFNGVGVNMDVNLYTATIDKYILKQTPNYRNKWTG